MSISPEFWIWIQALLTLFIFSFLYKDNPFYRFAEHLFIGVSNGYFITLIFYNVVVPMLYDPIRMGFQQLAEEGLSWQLFNPINEANFFVIIPILIGSLYITRFIPKISWMIRIPIGATMGYSVAIAIPALLEASILKQLKSSILTQADMTGFWPSVSLILTLLGTLATLVYFFFSKEHKGALKITSQIGIAFVMVAFGASFGLTVLGRVALAIGRFVFLFKDWLGMSL